MKAIPKELRNLVKALAVGLVHKFPWRVIAQKTLDRLMANPHPIGSMNRDQLVRSIRELMEAVIRDENQRSTGSAEPFESTQLLAYARNELERALIAALIDNILRSGRPGLATAGRRLQPKLSAAEAKRWACDVWAHVVTRVAEDGAHGASAQR